MAETANAPELTPASTLHELLSFNLSSAGVDEVRRVAALSVSEGSVGEASLLGKKVSQWASADLAAELTKAFAINPFELLEKAWSQARKLNKAARESCGPPPDVKTEAILAHEVDIKLAPRLVLNVNGIDWCTINLGVTLKLAFDSAQLKFNNGQLTALKLGNPSGKITLKCEGHDIAEFKRDIKVHAEYLFKQPIAWPALSKKN
ncbi:MAG: hypothetical protein FJY56_07740 [Betaproteobacteria bacterium]|nr:hypothetical protein [Betaproteobacteria bacterium]